MVSLQRIGAAYENDAPQIWEGTGQARKHETLGTKDDTWDRTRGGHTWNSVSIERNNAANRFYDNTFGLFKGGGSTYSDTPKKEVGGGRPFFTENANW